MIVEPTDPIEKAPAELAAIRPSRRGNGLDTTLFDRDYPDMSLAGQQRQIEQILNEAGDGFCAFDRDWRITYFNRAAEAHTGMSRDQALGRLYWDIVPAASGSAVEPFLREAMTRRVPMEFTTPSAVRPGAFVAVRAFPIDGGLAMSFCDITERRDRHQKEREQAQRLELALAASGLGDWSWDLATDMVTLSERAAEIFGVQPGPVMTLMEVLTRINPLDVDKAAAAIEGALAGRVGVEIEYRVTPPGQEAELWVMSSAQAEYSPEGTPLRLQGVVGDISRRKAQEAELRDSEARFRVMADSAPAPVWMTRAEGAIEFVNQAFVDFTGCPQAQLLGDVWEDVLHPDDIAAVASTRAIAAAAAGGPAPYWVETRVRHGADVWRWVRTSSRPRFDPAGRFEGYVGIAMDITDIRAAESRQQLLINELNHRVKNTLATVQSIAMQSFRDDVDSRSARKHFTERLLALSAAHNVLTREHWESAEISDIASEAVRPYDDAEASRILVSGPRARVAPSAALALSMAFHELATNATKYGALSAPAGRAALTWRVDAMARAVDIWWRETGGPPVTSPTAKGFGSRLLSQGLASELGQAAVVTYDVTGLVCAIRAPLMES